MKLIPNLHDIDQKAVTQAGIPAEALMESAGQQVARAVQRQVNLSRKGVIVCGPGNNGGDGFVCARHLYEAGYHDITVVYTGQKYRNEALANLEKLMIALPIPLVNAKLQLDLALRHLQDADFVVDALFGSGLTRPIADLEARLVAGINDVRQTKQAWVLAVDLPSGIDGATGQVLGCAVQADATVTLAALKPGLYLQPGKSYAGELALTDIGIPAALIEEDDSPFRLIASHDAKVWLPPRLPNSYKYSYGNVLVIAGSQNMPGAAVLCSEAAMNAGAGLVTLAAPAVVFQQLLLMPEVMRLPLPDQASLGEASVPKIQEAIQAKKFSTVLIGPGLGREESTVQAVISLLNYLKTLDIPVVIDADGLYVLAQHPMMLDESFIVTPHVGECARLLGVESADVTADLLQAADRVREKFGAQVVLKSASTVIASRSRQSDAGCTWVSPTGNPGMATAGSGDVLSGIITAMAAQTQARQQPENFWQAAPLGVYLHGLAGDFAAKARTPYSMPASRITEFLPQAFQQVLNP